MSVGKTILGFGPKSIRVHCWMSGKAAWKAALAEYKLKPAKRGRTPAPSLSATDSNDVACESAISSDDVSVKDDKSQIELLK